MATKQKLRRIDIVRKKDRWVAESKGRTIDRADKKADLVKATAKKAKNSGRPTSVRIHGRDGRIQEERTYPRSADPKRSKG